MADGKFMHKVTIPPNTTADIYIPSTTAEGVTENGKALSSVKDLEIAGMEEGYLHVKAGSGTYHFSAPVKK